MLLTKLILQLWSLNLLLQLVWIECDKLLICRRIHQILNFVFRFVQFLK